MSQELRIRTAHIKQLSYSIITTILASLIFTLVVIWKQLVQHIIMFLSMKKPYGWTYNLSYTYTRDTRSDPQDGTSSLREEVRVTRSPAQGSGTCPLGWSGALCSSLAWFRTLSLHTPHPKTSTLVPRLRF